MNISNEIFEMTNMFVDMIDHSFSFFQLSGFISWFRCCSHTCNRFLADKKTVVCLRQLEQHVHGQKCCERKKGRREGTSIAQTPGGEYEKSEDGGALIDGLRD